MMSTGSLTLSRKITLLLASLGAILIVVTVIAFVRLGEVEGRYVRMFDKDARALLVIPRMNVNVHNAARLTFQKAGAATPQEAARLDREIASIRARMTEDILELRQSVPNFDSAAADILRAFDSLLLSATRTLGQIGPADRARALFQSDFGPRLDRLQNYFQALSQHIRASMLDGAKTREATANRVIRRTLFASVLALAAGLILAQLWVWRSIGRPLNDLVLSVRRLIAGDTHLDIPGGGRTDEIGLLASALGIFRGNLVQKKQLEEEERETLVRLQKSESQLANRVAFQKALIDTIPYPIFIKDADARFVGCNRAYEQAFATTSAHLKGKTVLDLEYIPPEDAARFHIEDQEVIDSRGRRTYELPILFADGEPHVTLYSVDGFCHADGCAGGLIGLLVDITDRKAAEEELRRSQNLLQSVTDNAEAFIFVKDLSGRYLFVNRLYVDLLKRPASELLGRTVHDIFPSESAAAFSASESEILKDGLPRVTEAATDVDGKPRYFLAHKFPLFDPDGRMYALAGVSTDITEIKLTQQELARARDAAEAANRAKSGFVAAMSHEIRTPMNAIINMTALALESELSPRQRQYVSVAHSSARSLLALLNDILDFSKIEADRLELEAAPFGLRQLVEEVADSFRGRVLETRLEFAALVADEVPDALIGDTLRLRQVLINLLGNAFKFTERGDIVVRVALAPRESSPAAEAEEAPPDPGSSIIQHPSSPVALRFSVRDTGIGIPPEKLASLFSAFSQADTSTSRKYGGTGLGLAISKRLVGLMRGSIAVTSEPGRGSEFSFTAQFGRASGSAAPPQDSTLPGGLQNTRALIVEDNEISRELLLSLLTRFGLQAEAVATGSDALSRLHHPGDDQPFGLLIVDWLLPDTNGVDLTREIRNLPGKGGLPVIMVSAYAGEEAERSAQSVGIHAFIPKPITGSLLLDAIVRATGLRPELLTSTPANDATGTLFKGRHILVAEDNEANQLVARELLTRAGATVEIAGDGAEAIEMVATGKFDLVLMDMQMPRVDGLDATRQIRAAHPDLTLPIIALTANALKSDVDACLAAGMDDYLAKPIDRALLVALLRRWLEEKPTRPPDAAPEGVPNAISLSDPAPATDVPDAPAEEGPHTAPPSPLDDPVSDSVTEPSPPIEGVSFVAEDSTSLESGPASDDILRSHKPPAAPRRRPRRRPAVDPQLDLLPTAEPITELPARELVASGRLPGIDLDDAIRRLGLPKEVIETMLLQFGRGQRQVVNQLREAIEGEDGEATRRLAHSLAGAAGNLSAHELRRLAKTIELAVKYGKGNLPAMVTELGAEAARVFEGLDILAELRAQSAPSAQETASKPGPAASTNPPDPALARLFLELAENLDNGDLGAIQESLRALKSANGRLAGDQDFSRIEAEIDAFNHAAAAALARNCSARET